MEALRVAEAGEEAPAVASGAVPAQLVGKATALVGTMRRDELQVDCRPSRNSLASSILRHVIPSLAVT